MQNQQEQAFTTNMKLGGSGVERRDMCMMEINGLGCLPRDVIIEILSRLQVKVLCKFRCVSKQWLNMLTKDPYFLTQHRKNSKTNPLLLFRKYSPSSSSSSEEEEETTKHRVMVDLTSITMEGSLVNKIRAPTSGPVYTFSSCEHLIFMKCMYRLYVCNPGTGELVPIPRSSVNTYSSVGFGYLSDSNEYKIVHNFFSDSFLVDHQEMGCEVFTLRDGDRIKSGSWKRIEDRSPYKISADCLPVSVNGVIYYWMMIGEEKKKKNPIIVSFDLEKEKFEVISCPEWYLETDQSLVFLTGFKRSVCLCLIDCSSTTTSVMDIWKLIVNKKSSIWVKEFSINLFPPLSDNCEIRGLVPCDDQSGTGEVLIFTERKGLICYNILNNTFKVIESSHVAERYKQPCLFYESFFSLSSN